MTFKTAAALSVAILLAGCAQAVDGPLFQSHSKAPKEIAPISVTSVDYQGWSCEQLYREALRIDVAITATATRQTDTRRTGLVRDILYDFPISTLFGRKVDNVDNVDPEFAHLTKQLAALDWVYQYKNCSVVTATLPEPPPID
ncbi:MAG: hypothetical protein JXQ99_08405 [Hyphomicrobiaceae bacterium]